MGPGSAQPGGTTGRLCMASCNVPSACLTRQEETLQQIWIMRDRLYRLQVWPVYGCVSTGEAEDVAGANLCLQNILVFPV